MSSIQPEIIAIVETIKRAAGRMWDRRKKNKIAWDTETAEESLSLVGAIRDDLGIYVDALCAGILGRKNSIPGCEPDGPGDDNRN